MACKERAAKVGEGVLGRVWALVAALALLLGLAAFAPAPAQAASFRDVPSGQWYTSWVDQASDRGLMSGFTDPATGRPTGYFGPDEPLTRAQVATVLWRMAGGPSSGHASFPDVERGSWYDAPVAWCVKAGVVTGYTSGPDRGCFRPDRPVTRQELATMVWRYAKYAGMDVADPDPAAFRSTTDWRTVDSWASEALTWTAAAGVLSGVDNHDGTYSVVPFGTATRAMAAKVFVVLSGSPSAAKASYTVTFNSNGGSAVKAQAVRSGAKVTKPSDPTKANLSFVGWYADKALKKPYDFNSVITSNVALYAKWGAVTAILYSDGLLSIQLGDDVDSSHGHVVQKWTDLSQITVFWKRAPEVKSVVVRDRLKLDNLGSRFSGMSNCRMMDLSKLDVSGVESFAYMFSDCEALGELNLTGWDVSSAKVFAGMFQGCAALTAIDIREWAPARPEDLGNMFSGCMRLSDLRLPAWDTSGVTDFGGMFSDCRSLGSFDLSGWDTSNGDDFGYMFWHCVSIQKLDLSSFDMSNAKTVSQMFAFCSSLQELNLSGWSTSKVTKDDSLFFLCNSLQSITIGSDFTLQARIPSNSPWYDSEGNEYLSIPIGAAGTFTKTRPPERKCTVSFDAGDGSPVNAQTVSYGSKASRPADPAKAGYLFKGWYTDKSLTEAYDFGSAVESDLTLYAKWDANECTVTFVSNGGTSVARQTVSYGARASKPADPTRAGHAFKGWYSDKSLTEAYDFGSAVESDLTLYAKWDANECTVTFVSNGGTSVARQTVSYGARASKPADPAKAGHAFKGWYTDAACTEAYDFGSAVESDLTLYAKWDANECTVTFVSNGGTSVARQTVSYGARASKPADPTRAGHAFKGWYSDKSLTEAYDFGSAVESDLTLYAKWDANECTVTFVSNGGTSVARQTVSYGARASKPADPTLDGNEFAGWYTDAACTEAYDFGSAVESDLTLYAKWTSQFYAVLYKDGLLSLQAGADTDPSHGEVIGKWAWDGSSRPWCDKRARVRSVVARDRVAVSNGDEMFRDLANCWSMDLSRLDVSGASGLSGMFSHCSSLTSLDVSGWDVSGASGLSSMFSRCSSLTSLDVSGWDVSGASGLSSMFSRCSSLTSLDVSGWDVSGASDLSYMFSGCSRLQSLDVSGWDVSGASDLSYMFSGCSRLQSLDVSGWDVSGASRLSWMFRDCSSLTSLDVSGWDVSGASGLNGMFSGCPSLASLDVSGWDVSGASDLSGMFSGCSRLQSLDVSGWDISGASGLRSMFSGCSSLTSLDVSGWDVSGASGLSYMFDGCSSLTSLDVSGWDVSGASDLSGMFSGCSRLQSLDVSGWDVSGASGLSSMFSRCSSLTSLDVSGWDVSGASGLSYMFDGCSSLTSLDVSGWDVSGASDLSGMFSGCSSLTSLDVSGWDVSGASGLSSMFSGCSSLASLDVSGWDVSGASGLSSMFSGCSSLASLDVSGWDVSGASDFSGMFSGCSSLGTVTLGAGCGLLVKKLPNGPWYDAEGKEYDRPPAGVAGTFTKAKPATLALAVEGVSDAGVSLLAQIVEGEQDGQRYVVVPEGAPFECGLEYPELAGRYVGPGVYVTGYVGDVDSVTVPLEIDGAPVVSANLSWNDSDRAGMTRLASVSFEHIEGKASSLAQLDVSGNGLPSLDIEGLDALVRLNCEGNPIADLAALQAWAAQDGHEAKLSQVQDAAPAEPGDAAAPSEPSAPEQPSEPDTPAVEPGEPSEPDVPAEPNVPSEPSEPEVPSEPEAPATPEAPSESEEPSEEPASDEAPSDDSAASDEADPASDSLELGEGPISALAA